MPTGVVIGPFSAMRVALIDSSVASGSRAPSDSRAPAPATWGIHSMPTSAASSTRVHAAETSGPIPSPGMSVTRCGTATPYPAKERVPRRAPHA